MGSRWIFCIMPNSATPDYPTATAVVCHDAGAANIVIAGLAKTGRVDWRACMSGPAEMIWRNAFPGTPLCATPEQAIDGAELLITGSGWGGDTEHAARRLARDRGVRSVAVLDHWVNYPERFVRQGDTVWPDEFWVTDAEALQIARQIFPGQRVRQVPNEYLQDQLQRIAAVPTPATPEFLYVLEPIRSDWRRGVPGEFQALDYFVSKLPTLALSPASAIRLRPHPSETADKYRDWIAANAGLNLTLDDSASLAEAIGRADRVAGCETMALVLALHAGRTVYCTLPPWAPRCRLPQAGLIHLARQG